jgi:hydroxymethylglutaryl-CoA lyase
MHITECPRDAMQGLKHFVATELKVRYINALIRVGFDVLDFGSFVSPKAIPQMADTAQVVERLDLAGTSTRLLSVVLNERGAQDATAYPQVAIVGFPWSLSPTFQFRNGNQTPEKAWAVLQGIANIAAQSHRELLVYLSMGFGNPYGDPWEPALVEEAIDRIEPLGVTHFALADTVGAANEADIRAIFAHLRATKPHLTFGAHFHTTAHNWRPKVQAAWDAGCRHFDTALGGAGGCPYAQDELVGNLPTENLLTFAAEAGYSPELNGPAWQESQALAAEIFNAPV